MTQLGSLDEAAAYIKKLKERVDELQQKRSSAQLMAAGTSGGGRGGSVASTSAAATAASGGARSEEDAADEAAEAPVVEVVHYNDGSSLDVVLISSVERPFKLHEVVTGRAGGRRRRDHQRQPLRRQPQNLSHHPLPGTR